MTAHLPDETALFAFAPDGTRACALDAAVREGLASSLTVLLDAVGAPFDPEGARERALRAAIRARAVKPRVCGTYVDLVVALVEDRVDDGRALLDALLDQALSADEGLRVLTADDASLGPGQAERYLR